MALETFFEVEGMNWFPLELFDGEKIDRYIEYLSAQPVNIHPDYEGREITHERRFIRLIVEGAYNIGDGVNITYLVIDRGKVDGAKVNNPLGIRGYTPVEIDALMEETPRKE